MTASIANARMYAVAPAAEEAWRALLEHIASEADMPLTYLPYPAPQPLEQLWSRADLGAVLMCGYPIALRLADGLRLESSDPISSVGKLLSNDRVIDDTSVSRRHAAIVNYPDEVWLYDLDSTQGTMVDGRPVVGRVFLDGVHQVVFGKVHAEVASRTDLLV